MHPAEDMGVDSRAIADMEVVATPSRWERDKILIGADFFESEFSVVAECALGSDSAAEEFDFDAVRDIVKNFVNDTGGLEYEVGCRARFVGSSDWMNSGDGRRTCGGMRGLLRNASGEMKSYGVRREWQGGLLNREMLNSCNSVTTNSHAKPLMNVPK
jgi:hypothetical protein